MGVTEAKTQPAPSRGPLVFAVLFAGVLYLTGFWRQKPTAPFRAQGLRESGPSTERPAHFTPVRSRPESWTDVGKQIWTNIGRHRVMAIAGRDLLWSARDFSCDRDHRQFVCSLCRPWNFTRSTQRLLRDYTGRCDQCRWRPDFSHFRTRPLVSWPRAGRQLVDIVMELELWNEGDFRRSECRLQRR